MIVEQAVNNALEKAGFVLPKQDWVTENYALTHLLKIHRIGRKKLEKAMYVEGRVEWRHDGRNILIKRDSLNNLINPQ